MKRHSSPLLIFLWLAVVANSSYAAIYSASLTGPSEAPPNTSPATGNAIVDFNLLEHTLRVAVTFNGLLGTTTASHIHCCVTPPGAAPVATQVPTFSGFPFGVTNGSYSSVFDTLTLATWNPAFVTANGGTAAAAEAAMAAGLAAGTSYLNIHTTSFPGGEIRGFLTQATAVQVPEPSSIALVAIAAAACMASRRRRTAERALGPY